MKIFDPKGKTTANLDKIIPVIYDDWSVSPVLIEMDPSNACNHGCTFCLSSYIHFDEFKGTDTFSRSIMPKDMMLGCIDDFDEMGVRAVNFTGGGDPTVNPNLGDLLYHTGGSSLESGLFTNGAIMHCFDLFDAFVDNLEWVRFSVDAGSRESYNRIRQIRDEDDWDKMLENLQRTIERKKQKNSEIVIGVGFVMTEDTILGDSEYEIVNFAETFSEYDVDYVQYKSDTVSIKRWEKENYQRDLNLFDIIEEPLEKAKSILGSKYQCKTYGIEDTMKGAEHLNYYKKCLGSQIMPCVGADGHVYVCPSMRGMREYSYGSLYEKSFKEIWDDIQTRKERMYKVEEVDCFSNCTQLCKPHETNKVMWELYEVIEKTKLDYKHWKFI